MKMAIIPVNSPAAAGQNNSLGTLGGIISLIPHPAAKAVGTGMAVADKLQASNQPQQSAMPNTVASGFNNGSMARRQSLSREDPRLRLEEGLAALDRLDIDDERKKALRAPIEQALYKGSNV